MTTEQIKQVNLKRFPIELYDRLREIAKRHRRPVTQEIYHVLERYVDLMEKKVDSGVVYHVDPDK